MGKKAYTDLVRMEGDVVGTLEERTAKEQKAISRRIDVAASVLGIDSYYTATNKKYHKAYELCKDCQYLEVVKTKWDRVFAYCDEIYIDKHKLRLSSQDPVVECTTYRRRGEMSLSEMQDMAYLIEVDKKEIGFLVEVPTRRGGDRGKRIDSKKKMAEIDKNI